MSHDRTYTPGTVLVMVGNKRGLFLLTSKDRETWEVESTTVKGNSVFYSILDQRGGHRLFATDNGDFFGTFVRYSDDFGQTWQESEQGIQFPENSQQKLENIWVIEPGRPNEPGTIYAGVDPASLWTSTDGGQHWELNTGLANHPTRELWGPGARGLWLPPIIVYPPNTSPLWVGIPPVDRMPTAEGVHSGGFSNKHT